MEIQELVTVRVMRKLCECWVGRVVCVFSALTLFLGDRVHAWDALEKGWMTSFQVAEAAAHKAGVPMVVHFWAPWCGPCRNMEAEVLGTPEVQALLGNGIIGVKVNSDEHRDLVSRFGITALPTDVFVSAEGTVLSRSVGSPGRQGYLAKLSQHRVANPGPPAVPSPQSTEVAQAGSPSKAADDNTEADNRVETVTAAKPVFEESKTAEKAIVGLRVANDDTKTADDAGLSTETQPSTAPGSKPVVRNKALRKDDGLRIGLNGYSPVALSSGTKWQKGLPEFKHNFQGVRYLCCSGEELDQFKAAPEKFIPALHGCDPVSLVNDQVVQSGFVELGASFQSRMYFFSTKISREEFLKAPEKFAAAYNLAFFETEETSVGEPETRATDASGSESATKESVTTELGSTEAVSASPAVQSLEGTIPAADNTAPAEGIASEPATEDNN